MIRSLSSRLIFLVSITLCGILPALASGEDASIDPQEYFGAYSFDDGITVSGGRFDEAGRQMLLYVDTATVRRGAPLVKVDDGFEPAFEMGQVVHVDFHGQGSEMRWELPSGKVLKAKRVMQPEFRPAEFAGGDADLAGTLYLPPNAEPPFPAVVLAHGSGTVTRYAGTWITFFLQHHMAVLSYDKRGTGESGGNWKTSSYLDLADDLSAAVDWLGKQAVIDAKRIGVHTTSQSGWYGPHTARNNPGIAFLIQRAGPAVNIGLGTAHEIREEWRNEEVAADLITPAVAFWKELHALAARGGSLDDANAMLARAQEKPWFRETFEDWDKIDDGWWQRHAANMQLEPAKDAGLLDIPILWFLAEDDANVPYQSSLSALEAAQKDNEQLEVVTIENAGHNFLVTQPDGNVRYTEQYWSVIAAWLGNQKIIHPK